MTSEPAVRATGDVSVVIVAWNAAAMLPSCLAALPGDVRVVVVDNASDDDSGPVARRFRPDAVVVRTERNLGFAGGVTEGLRYIGDAGAVLLLNPDARLSPNGVGSLADFLRRRPRVALVSALVVDEHGRPERFAGGRALSLRSLAVHELGLSRLLPAWSTYQPGPVSAPEPREWVAATAVLVRTAALEAVGGPDPSFFLYAEDRDWCRRLRADGWEVWVEPAVRAVHAGSASVNAAGSWVDAHRVGALDRYWCRLHGGRHLAAFRALRLAGAALRAVALSVLALLPGDRGGAARAAQRRRDAWLRGHLLLRGRLPARLDAVPGTTGWEPLQ